MQTSDLNVNNTESDHANAIFRQFQDAIFSREHTYVKTLTKIIFDLLQWQEIATLSLPKKPPSLLSSQQHFAGVFASEPMTLPEIDHVSFLVEHAQTFFAGKGISIVLAFSCGCVYDSNMLRVVTYLFENGGKNLRYKKYPDITA